MDFDYYLYVIFSIPCICTEFYISKRNYSTKLSKDRGTFFLLWFIITLANSCTVFFIRFGYGMKIVENNDVKYFLWIPTGLILYFTGILIRKQAIEQLGQWFTTVVDTDKDQQLIDFGWYGKMRHPSYTGVLMYFFGVTLLLNNWLGLLGIMTPVASVFLYRIKVEEEELRKHFRAKYDEYRRKVPYKIIPNIF